MIKAEMTCPHCGNREFPMDENPQMYTDVELVEMAGRFYVQCCPKCKTHFKFRPVYGIKFQTEFIKPREAAGMNDQNSWGQKYLENTNRRSQETRCSECGTIKATPYSGCDYCHGSREIRLAKRRRHQLMIGSGYFIDGAGI